MKDRPDLMCQDRIGRNEDGSLDEVVIHHPELFHLEQMSKRTWWLGVTKDGRTMHLSIHCDKKGHLSVEVTDDEMGCPVAVDDGEKTTKRSKSR